MYLCASVQNSNSFDGSVAEAGGIYWHLAYFFECIGMRVVLVVKYLVEHCSFV